MKNLVFSAFAASVLALNACGDASSSKSPEEIKAKAVADLSKMEVPEIIDFVDNEATEMTAVLATVTDGPSAEAAVEEIRRIVPRFNAAFATLEDMDTENMKLSFGDMRKMMKVAQSQAGLLSEVSRISKIPEAREVLEREFDKIEITGN